MSNLFEPFGHCNSIHICCTTACFLLSFDYLPFSIYHSVIWSLPTMHFLLCKSVLSFPISPYPNIFSIFTSYSQAVTYFKLLPFCIHDVSSFHEQWKHLVFCLLSHRDCSGRAGPGPEGRLEAECRFGNYHHLRLLLLLQVNGLHICTL